MLTDTAAVRTYFAKLGLGPEVADIYLALHAYGPQSIAALSRNSGVERTHIYRLIDTLLASELIEVETHGKRGIVKAAPIANLRILINQKEQELKSLQDELGLIEQALARNSLSSPAVRVQFYYGIAGARQMLWNAVGTTGGVSCLLYAMPVKETSKFWKRWAAACNDAQLSFRILANNDTLGAALRQQLTAGSYRRLDPQTLPITYTTLLYADTIACFYQHDGELYGVETYNQPTADTQRHLFEILWQQA